MKTFRVYLSLSLVLTSVAVYLMTTSFFSEEWVTEEVTANLKGVVNVLIRPIMTGFKKPLPETFGSDVGTIDLFTALYPDVSAHLGIAHIDPSADIDIKNSYSLRSHRDGVVVDVSVKFLNATNINPFSSMHFKEKLKPPFNLRIAKFAFTERLIIVSIVFTIASCFFSLLTSTTIESKKIVKKCLFTATTLSCLIAGGFAFAAVTKIVKDSNFAEDIIKEKVAIESAPKNSITNTVLQLFELRQLKSVTYGCPVIAVVVTIFILSFNAVVNIYHLIQLRCGDIKIEKVENYEMFDKVAEKQ